MTIRIVHMGTCCKHWFCHQVGTEDNKNGCCTIGHVRVHLITRSAGKRKVEFSKFEGYPSSCPYFQGAAGIATPARYFEFQAAPRSLKAQMNYGIKIIKTEEQLNYGTKSVSKFLSFSSSVVYCFPASRVPETGTDSSHDQGTYSNMSSSPPSGHWPWSAKVKSAGHT